MQAVCPHLREHVIREGVFCFFQFSAAAENGAAVFQQNLTGSQKIFNLGKIYEYSLAALKVTSVPGQKRSDLGERVAQQNIPFCRVEQTSMPDGLTVQNIIENDMAEPGRTAFQPFREF